MVDNTDEAVMPERVAWLLENGRRAYRETLPGERVHYGLDLSRHSELFARSTNLVRRAYLPLLGAAGLMLLAELTLMLGMLPGVAVALTGISALIAIGVALVLIGSLRRWHNAAVGALAHQNRGPIGDTLLDD